MTGADCPCVCHGRWQHPCDVEGGCGHLHTDRPAEPAVDYDMARLQLDAAVQQLIQPSTEKLDRDHDSHDLADDRDEERDLERQHAAALRRNDHAAARRALERLIDHRRRAATTQKPRTVRQTQLPSLIDLLQDELAASTSRGGAPSAGATRSLLALPIAELLGDIRHTLRTSNPPAPRHHSLTEQLRAWNQHAGWWQTDAPDQLLRNADAAERWVATARTLLNPPRTFGLVGECPHCHRRTAHVRDDTGETVRRDAIQVSYADETARCAGCGTVWDDLTWLGRVLAGERDEKAG